jgi:RNA polymerase sigma-70 factor (family 1)
METITTKLISSPVNPAGESDPRGGSTPRSAAGELSFEALYKLYFVRLFRFSFSIIHVKESAEEIVNDVFLRLWEKRGHSMPPIENSPAAGPLSSIGNIELYLYVSVKNRSLNYLRDNAGLTTVEISERCDAYIRFDTNPETLLLGAEAQERIRTAINQLPPRCRLIFSLIKEDGLKYKEVARLLELSVKTVEAQLVIAIRKIAQSLEKER